MKKFMKRFMLNNDDVLADTHIEESSTIKASLDNGILTVRVMRQMKKNEVEEEDVGDKKNVRRIPINMVWIRSDHKVIYCSSEFE